MIGAIWWKKFKEKFKFVLDCINLIRLYSKFSNEIRHERKIRQQIWLNTSSQKSDMLPNEPKHQTAVK